MKQFTGERLACQSLTQARAASPSAPKQLPGRVPALPVRIMNAEVKVMIILNFVTGETLRGTTELLYM